MLAAVAIKWKSFIVTKIGPLSLDVDLQAGEFRALTSEEVAYFYKASTKTKIVLNWRYYKESEMMAKSLSMDETCSIVGLRLTVNALSVFY